MTDAEKLIEALRSNAELIRENAALLDRLEGYEAVAQAAEKYVRASPLWGTPKIRQGAEGKLFAALSTLKEEEGDKT